jgi:F-type H+-transporting ATPase subunit delta
MKYSSPLAKRYANALIDVAIEKKALKPVVSDVNDLNQLLDTNQNFNAFVQSVAIDNADQANALEKIAQKGKFHELTVNFLMVLVKNNRLHLLKEFLSAFVLSVQEREGYVQANVKTAHDLSAAQQKSLRSALESLTGQKVNATISTDSDLLGGMVIMAGSLMIDDSVRSKLNRLERAMTGHANTNIKTASVG